MNSLLHQCIRVAFVSLVGVATCSLVTGAAAANDEAQTETPIVSAAAAKYLPKEDAERKLAVELRGVVTCVPSGWKGFFLDDGSAGIYCEPQSLEAEKLFWPIQVGEQILLRGVTAPGHRNSFVSVSGIVSRETGILPAPPLKTIQQVITEAVDADFVRMRGHIVGLINIAGQMEYGLLADGVEAHILHMGFRIDPKVYDYAEVEICGVVIPQEADSRRVRILVPEANSFRMLSTQLNVMKATPKHSIEQTLLKDTDRNPLIHVSGDVFCSDNDTIWLTENGTGIAWNARGVILPEGTRHVELFGIAKRQGRQCRLEYATVLSTSAVAAESRVLVHRNRSVTADGESNRVVTLNAVFWDSNTFNSEIVLSFDVDQSKLTCRLLGELENKELQKLQRGADYRITGLLNTVSVGGLDTHELLVRSLSDVVQVSGPPWPVRFTLYIVSLLSAGLAVGLVSAVYSWKQALVVRQRLEAARNELRETNETLEARVAARTLELDRTNQRLLDEATARLLVENENANTLVSLEDAQALAQIGSFYWNATTNTSSWSKQSYLIHGLDPDQRSPGLDDYGDRVAEIDRVAFQQYLERAARSSEREQCRYQITTPQGDVRWLRSLVRSVHDSDGSLIAMDGVFQDITDMVKAEEQLRQSMKMEVAGCMAGGIAHDLNNTLTIIRLNCYLLSAELQALAVSQVTLDHVVGIENATEKSAMLTRQLLTFSRKQMIRPVELNINTTIQAFRPLLKQLLDDTVNLEMHLAELIADVRLDPGQLEQIVMNLILNARDAIAGPGQIIVETANVTITHLKDLTKWILPPRPGDYVSISVTDNGAGIAQENLHRIFEPFFSTKGQEKGTGLGLAVVHGIARQNDGGLLVESRKNHGTMFQILIPVVRQTDGSIANRHRRLDDSLSSQLIVPRSDTKESILLVDDEAAVGKYTQQVLERLGYSVTTMNSAIDALRLVEAGLHQFQLLITDYSMPNMTGLELAKQIRVHQPSIHVILMSGYLNEEAFRNLPVELTPIYIQKPFSIHEIAARVRQSLMNVDPLPQTAAG